MSLTHFIFDYVELSQPYNIVIHTHLTLTILLIMAQKQIG